MGSDAQTPFIARKTRDLQKRSAPAPKSARETLAHAPTQKCGQAARRARRRTRLEAAAPETWQHSAKQISIARHAIRRRKAAPAKMSHGGVTASTRSDLDDISAVERDLKDRQEQFIRRERVYKMRLEELRKELAALKDDKISWMKDDPNMQKIREAQAEVSRNVGLVQGETASAVQAQETDLLKRFRGRLQVVQDELAAAEAKGRRRCQRMDRARHGVGARGEDGETTS